eukprot:g5309.t1
MFRFCKEKLQTSQKTASSFLNDLLFTSKSSKATEDDKTVKKSDNLSDTTMLCYDNKAFEDQKPQFSLRKHSNSTEVARAYERGKTSGIWLGKMHQKLDNLQEQWNKYLKTAKRPRRHLRTNPASNPEPAKPKGHSGRSKSGTKRQVLKRKSVQVPMSRSSIVIKKHKKPNPSKK